MSFFDRIFSHREANLAFSSALAQYHKLRTFPVYSWEYKLQLFNIAHVLQKGIACNNHHGDNHVMLANIYLLLHNDYFPSNCIVSKYLAYSAAVIKHWADEPMRKYPWTKNIAAGEMVLTKVIETIDQYEMYPGRREFDIYFHIKYDLATLKTKYYLSAITDVDLS